MTTKGISTSPAGRSSLAFLSVFFSAAFAAAAISASSTATGSMRAATSIVISSLSALRMYGLSGKGAAGSAGAASSADHSNTGASSAGASRRARFRAYSSDTRYESSSCGGTSNPSASFTQKSSSSAHSGFDSMRRSSSMSETSECTSLYTVLPRSRASISTYSDDLSTTSSMRFRL